MLPRTHLSPDDNGSGSGEGGWATSDYAGPILSKPTQPAGTYEERSDAAPMSSQDFSKALAAVDDPAEQQAPAPQEQNKSKDEAEGETDASKAPAQQGAKRSVSITDESGKRIKVSYDPNDHARMDKIVAEAAGFRKMQAERDRFRNEAQTLAASKASVDNWNALERVWAEHGKEGVIDRLLGGDGTGSKLREYHNAKYEERLKLEEMTPSERARHELAEQMAAERRQREAAERRMNELLTKNEQRQNELDIRAVQQEVAPFVQKYSLEGKIGSPNIEKVLNKQIQEMAYGEIEKLAATLPPDADIPPHLLDRAFRRAKDFYSRDIEALIQSKAKDSQTQSRVKAQEAAAAAAGVRTSGAQGQGTQAASSAKSSFGDLVSKALGWKG